MNVQLELSSDACSFLLLFYLSFLPLYEHNYNYYNYNLVILID